MNDMLKEHGLDKLQAERTELGLQSAIKKAQEGDQEAFLLAALVQSNVYLVARLKQLEGRIEQLEAK
tara:strand:+ start:69 stop:269 length:201 start_codon:yes stop_codon:yes gene_type:complete